MNYIESVNWIENRNIPLGEFTTDNIKALLELFDKPQNNYKTIHITGTNGKGSVANFLSNSLIENNYKVGKFTSPYITNIREQVQINEKNIDEYNFTSIANELIEKVEYLDKKEIYVSGFELITALAFIYFSKENVDIAVIEVGMGGRVDSTNVMEKSIPVFCHISLDHVNILGNNLKEISTEKGGIIKENSNVFSYPQEKEASETLKKISIEKNSEYNEFSKDEVEIISSNGTETIFNFRDNKNVKINLIGEYQSLNASLALSVLDYLKDDLKLEESLIKKGLEKTKNIGRIEVLDKNPTIIVDGSHNLDSVKRLVESIKKFKYNNLILGFSLLIDKDHDHILKLIEEIADYIVLTEIDNDRHTDLKRLEEEFRKISDKKIIAIKDREEAARKTLELSNKDDLILWCGSLYLIKDIRKILMNKLK